MHTALAFPHSTPRQRFGRRYKVAIAICLIVPLTALWVHDSFGSAAGFHPAARATYVEPTVLGPAGPQAEFPDPWSVAQALQNGWLKQPGLSGRICTGQDTGVLRDWIQSANRNLPGSGHGSHFEPGAPVTAPICP